MEEEADAGAAEEEEAAEGEEGEAAAAAAGLLRRCCMTMSSIVMMPLADSTVHYIGSCRPFWVKLLVATRHNLCIEEEILRGSIWESGGCRRQIPPASPSRPVQRTSTAARGAVRRYALMHQSLQQLNSNRRWLSDLLLEESKESK